MSKTAGLRGFNPFYTPHFVIFLIKPRKIRVIRKKNNGEYVIISSALTNRDIRFR